VPKTTHQNQHHPRPQAHTTPKPPKVAKVGSDDAAAPGETVRFTVFGEGDNTASTYVVSFTLVDAVVTSWTESIDFGD
jgi:hypothetical protein